MSWTDTLHKVRIETINGEIECVGASFNGVSFFVEEASSNGGRNVVTTALPFTDVHINEDVGGRIREYPIRFYLLGANVEFKREKLEEAFNTAGALEFVHPHYGKFFARCTKYSLSFRKSECEYVSGEATFVAESDPKSTASNVTDERSQGIAKANATLDESSAEFKSGFSLVGKAKSIVDTCIDVTESILDGIESARQSLRDVNGFVTKLSQLRENIGLILMTPSDFAARVENLLTMTKETFSFEDESFSDYVNESLTVMDGIEIDDGDMGVNELSAKIQTMALLMAAAMVVKSVMEAEYSTAEEVHETQERISNVFENARSKVLNASEYAALSDLEGCANKFLTDELSKLAVILKYPLLTSRNALSVCFDVYGTLDKFDDLLSRNAIVDAMTITRKSLKVLSK